MLIEFHAHSPPDSEEKARIYAAALNHAYKPIGFQETRFSSKNGASDYCRLRQQDALTNLNPTHNALTPQPHNTLKPQPAPKP